MKVSIRHGLQDNAYIVWEFEEGSRIFLIEAQT